MSAITINGDLVHYEKLGRGRPVILLHSWIGSWRYWVPLMQKLHLRYSVYSIDMVGYGDSVKNPEHYNIMHQVRMLERFLDQLAIPKAAIIAHGMGTLVATHFALRNPEVAVRMLLSSIPLFDPGELDKRVPAGVRRKLTGWDRYSLAPGMDDVESEETLLNRPGDHESPTIPTASSNIGSLNELPTAPRGQNIDREILRQAAEARVSKRNNMLAERLRGTTMDFWLDRCFRRNEPEYEKLSTDVGKADDLAMLSSADGYEAGEFLDDLRRITAPIVAVHGLDDPFVESPGEDVWNYLTIQQEDVFVPILLPGVRHFPMLESESFTRLALDFLNVAEISKLELRERWRRRSI
jgi:pimeloyl-ACP methyl ester carboxylesterase